MIFPHTIVDKHGRPVALARNVTHARGIVARCGCNYQIKSEPFILETRAACAECGRPFALGERKCRNCHSLLNG
jgi:hypothetical protein